MRKSILTLFTAVLLLAGNLCFAQDKLTSHIPKDVDVYVIVDVNRLLALESVQQFMDETEKAPGNKEFRELKAMFAAKGIDIKDAFKKVAVFHKKGNQKGGALIKTSIDEQTFTQILKERAAEKKEEVVTETVEGRTVYIRTKPAEQPEGQEQPAKPKQVNSTVYVAPDVIFSSKTTENVKNYFTELSKGTVAENAELSARKETVDTQAMVWGVFSNPDKMTGPPQQGQRPNPMAAVQGGNLALNVSGEDQRTFQLNVKAECLNAQAAKAMSSQLQGMIMMFVPQMFKKDMQLGQEVAGAAKITAAEKNVELNLQVSGALQDRIKAYQKMLKEGGKQGGESQPQPTPPAPETGKTGGAPKGVN